MQPGIGMPLLPRTLVRFSSGNHKIRDPGTGLLVTNSTSSCSTPTDVPPTAADSQESQQNRGSGLSAAVSSAGVPRAVETLYSRLKAKRCLMRCIINTPADAKLSAASSELSSDSSRPASLGQRRPSCSGQSISLPPAHR